MVVCMLDLIEKLGFRWNGKYYTCGFYRIKDNMGTYYLEKFVGYRNRRVEYILRSRNLLCRLIQ